MVMIYESDFNDIPNTVPFEFENAYDLDACD